MKNGISRADILEEFHAAAVRYGGNKKLAGDMDMAPSTLSNKLQAYPGPENRNRLNLGEADDILSITGDMQPLMLLAARFGYLLMPMRAEPDAPTALEEAIQDVQSLAAYQAAKQLPTKERIFRLNTLVKDLMQTDTAIARERGEEE